jgi:hypothetical protein
MSEVVPETAAVPGTGEVPVELTTPPAEASNTDGQSTPETIPYARFKEVNDAYRPFKELTDQGYDADSLRRLAEWEQAFSSDPSGSWLSLAGQIEGLPEPVLEAIRQANGASETPPAPQGSGSETPPPPEEDYSKPPEWAEPLIQDYHQRVQQGERQARDEVLNDILTKWDEMDKADGLVDDQGRSIVPANIRLSFIAGAAGSATSQEQILETARKEALEMLEVGRRSLRVPSGGDAPRPVSGSAAVTPAPPITPKTLEEASRLAKADIEAGRLQLS